jgi:hypothetical protein
MNPKIILDCLPVNLISEISNYAGDVKKHRTNLTSWPSNVVGSSGTILIFDIENDSELFSKLKTALLPIVGQEFEGKKWIFTFALGSYLSFIPWHEDHSHLRSMTIYLNEAWDKNCGGYFLYESKDGIRAEAPTFNKGILFTPPLQHSTTIPSLNAPLRMSLQLFVDNFDD